VSGFWIITENIMETRMLANVEVDVRQCRSDSMASALSASWASARFFPAKPRRVPMISPFVVVVARSPKAVASGCKDTFLRQLR
jgi:hypothetical protein